MPRKLTLILYCLLGFNFLYVLSGALLLPMESVDVVGIWMFKTKAFFVEGGLPLQTLNNPDFLLFHPQYPLLLPALYSLFYFAVGRVWELPILMLYPLYYVGILYVVWKVIKELGVNDFKAALYVYIYSMFSPLLGQAGRGHAGSADIVVVLLAWVAIWIFPKIEQDSKKAWMVVLITMIASQIKLEGLFLGALLLMLNISWPKKVVFSVLSALPILLWMGVVKWLEIPSDFTFVVPSLWELVERSGLIIQWSFKEMFNLKNWYVFWPLFWLALWATPKEENNFIRKLGATAILVSGAYVLVYLTVTTNVEDHIASSIDRVLFQITPFVYPIFIVKSQKMLRKFT